MHMGIDKARCDIEAFAIMGGLLVATLLTLVFLPVLYVIWFAGGNREIAVRHDIVQ